MGRQIDGGEWGGKANLPVPFFSEPAIPTHKIRALGVANSISLRY